MVRWLFVLAAVVLVACLGGRSRRAVAPLPPTTSETAPTRTSDAPRSGPVPDFAPMLEVRTHQDLDNLAPQVQFHLQRIFGAQSVVEVDGDADDSMVWMRDYHPMYVARGDGTDKVVAYLSENPMRANLADRRRSANTPEVALADEVVPLLHENGNLVTNGRLVFVSERIIEDNVREFDDEHLLELGYTARDRDEIVALLARALERPPADIIIVPRMPLEATGHVDLWLMFLDEKTALIPEVRAEAIAQAPEDDKPAAEDIAGFLDVEADALFTLGLDVVRLPMLPPLTVPAVDEPPSSGTTDTLFLSPANALLLATKNRRDVVLPSVDLSQLMPHLQPLQDRYEDEWEEFFDEAGWTPWSADSTELARHLGLIRCVTAPIPF